MEVSIIVPIYNAEKYLNKCIDSILSQTFTDFELILVDDGSTDGSPFILDRYKEYDPRVVVIHKPNGGVSSARNAGIEVALGKYILFIDSDDYIASEYIHTMLRNMGSCEWVFSGICDFASDRNDKPFEFPDASFDLSIERDYFRFINLGLFNAPFPKLYVTSIIAENHILFNTCISFSEDRDFNLQYMQYVSKVRTIPYIGYYYRGDTPGSLAKTATENLVTYDCKQWDLERLNTEKRGFRNMEMYLYSHLFNLLNDSLYRFGKNALDEVSDRYIEMLNKHFVHIESPLWQKWLLVHKYHGFLSLIYRIK